MSWSQFTTILWLRWRLTRNQFAGRGTFNAIIVTVAAVFGILLAISVFIGGILGAVHGLSMATPMVSLIVWDALAGVFLFFWMIGVLAEVQRAESIDLARLLHMPVSIQGVFTMNYVASLLTPSIIIFLPGTVGVCLGLIWAKGWLMALLLPLILSFVFLVTAWTYCLRGWLVTVMVNPRKRRNVIFLSTVLIVGGAQLPNLFIHGFIRGQVTEHKNSAVSKDEIQSLRAARAKPVAPPEPNGQVPPVMLAAHEFVPLLWLPNGAMALAEGNILGALLGSLGGFALGAWGLARAYRTTLRFYQGCDTANAARGSSAAVNSPVPRKNFLDRDVPFVSEEVAALSLAFFRSFSRAPEVKLGLFVNVIVLVAVVPILFLRPITPISAATKPFLVMGVVGFAFFGLIQQMFNLFGFDRDGFRALVLSPSRRRDVLLAKNLALSPIALALGLAMLAALGWLARLPLLILLAGIFKLGGMFLFLCVLGNWVSVWIPFRVTAGSLKPSKPPPKTILLTFLTQLLFPFAMIPIAVPPLLGLLSDKMGWWPASVVDLACSMVLLAAAAAVYWLSLADLGRMFESREQRILQVVSQAGE